MSVWYYLILILSVDGTPMLYFEHQVPFRNLNACYENGEYEATKHQEEVGGEYVISYMCLDKRSVQQLEASLNERGTTM